MSRCAGPHRGSRHGGIRIEDDIIVTETGSRMIGGDKRIPITVDELEAVVGR